MVVSLSHIDLDGVGCQIVLNKNLKNVEYLNCNYDKIEDHLIQIEEILDRRKVSHCFITDLSFNIQQMKALNSLSLEFPDTKFVVIDHHPLTLESSLELTSSNTKCIVNMDKCATQLTYDYFKNSPASIGKLVSYINSFDIWLSDTEEFKKGIELNDLFWSYKLKRFFNTFANDVNKNHVIRDLNELKEKREKYFSTAVNKGLIYEIPEALISFCGEFMSWIQIKYPDKKAYINANVYGKISIRLSSDLSDETCEIIKTRIANETPKEKIITFGGHHRAFSMQHTGRDNVQEIQEHLKRISDIILKEIK